MARGALVLYGVRTFFNLGFFAANRRFMAANSLGTLAPYRALGRMGFFAALMTYLVAATLLIGGAVAGLSVLLAPSDMLTPRSAPPLVRAADRKAVQAPKPEPSPQPKAAVSLPEPASAPSSASAVNPVVPTTPQVNNTAQVKEQAAAQPAQATKPVRKKKIAKKPAPQREADTTTLGYGPSEPQRRFIFPLDPGW